MKTTKLIIALLAGVALAGKLNRGRKRLNKLRKAEDLGRWVTTEGAKLPGSVIGEISTRATHIGPILEGILNEPRTETGWLFYP